MSITARQVRETSRRRSRSTTTTGTAAPGTDPPANRRGMRPLCGRPVERPQAERHPLRHLQLEMRVVDVAEGQEREDEAGDERGAPAASQRPHQQEHPDARQDESRQEDQVVHCQLRHAKPEERRRHQRRHEHRVGEGQRAAFGIEDVGVEQVATDRAAAGAPPRRVATSRRARHLR